MKIKRQNGTFDIYTLEVSRQELLSIQGALAGAQADPVADDMLKAVDWYVENLPGPGETAKDHKERTATDEEVPSDLPPIDSLKASGQTLEQILGGYDTQLPAPEGEEKKTDEDELQPVEDKD